MPTYEYECSTCGTFEEFQRITEDPLAKCPACGSAVQRLISSGTGIIFKGSGFYATDSRNAEKQETSKTDGDGAGKDEPSGDANSKSKSSAKTDTKKKEAPTTTTAKD